MLVHQILQEKSAAGVFTIAPGTTLAEAVEILAARRIGALVVSIDGLEVQGILSERDVVRELGQRGTGCLNDAVESVMTREIVSCGPDENADHVLRKMTEGRFRHMPVLRDAKMVGLISIGDVVKARLAELNMEKDALTGMIMGM